MVPMLCATIWTRPIARAGFYPDRSTTAEQRNRIGLLEESGRLAAENVAIEASELKWYLRIGNRFTHERFSALPHQTHVEAVHETVQSSSAGQYGIDLGSLRGEH